VIPRKEAIPSESAYGGRAEVWALFPIFLQAALLEVRHPQATPEQHQNSPFGGCAKRGIRLCYPRRATLLGFP
jgi:hypothetical protein